MLCWRRSSAAGVCRGLLRLVYRLPLGNVSRGSALRHGLTEPLISSGASGGPDLRSTSVDVVSGWARIESAQMCAGRVANRGVHGPPRRRRLDTATISCGRLAASPATF